MGRNGVSALELARQLRPHIVLMDFHMLVLVMEPPASRAGRTRFGPEAYCAPKEVHPVTHAGGPTPLDERENKSMNGPNRYSDTFSKAASDNRWYRWLAVGSFILAMGLLTVYILQRLGVISESPF